MKKIAIFEDEYILLEGAFAVINRLLFNDEIIFDVFSASQDFNDLKNIVEYNGVIVDIELAYHSHLDGYNIVKEINIYAPTMPILILSGNSKSSIASKIIELNLSNTIVITKPVSYIDLFDFFKNFI